MLGILSFYVFIRFLRFVILCIVMFTLSNIYVLWYLRLCNVLRLVVFTFWNCYVKWSYILGQLRLVSVRLSDVYVVLCYVLSLALSSCLGLDCTASHARRTGPTCQVPVMQPLLFVCSCSPKSLSWGLQPRDCPLQHILQCTASIGCPTASFWSFQIPTTSQAPSYTRHRGLLKFFSCYPYVLSLLAAHPLLLAYNEVLSCPFLYRCLGGVSQPYPSLVAHFIV